MQRKFAKWNKNPEIITTNTTTTTTTVLRPLFRDHPGEPMPEETGLYGASGD